jgi:XRE family aerobic/anaerobic benzoate catabolism transcriptional regulator
MSQAEQKEAALVINEWLGKRRRSRRGVAILGLRGAGKSTIGRLFAERHGLSFVSVTREIESRTGLPLNDLFNLGGADAYRAMETETILSLAAKSGFTVLETAGGIVANREALDAVLSTYRSVWLKASAEEHLERVISQGDMRPIKGAPRALEHVRNLLDQRNAEYVQAEFMLDTTGRSPMECVKELERMLGYLSESPEE